MNTISIITFVIFGLISSMLLLVGFFIAWYAIYTYKQIKKSSNTLNHFIELVKGNMDKESLKNILTQFDEETILYMEESVIHFNCHNSHTSQYKALRNIILHRIELIEMIDEYKQESLQNIKNKKQ